jgi:hypothetical protein
MYRDGSFRLHALCRDRGRLLDQAGIDGGRLHLLIA